MEIEEGFYKASRKAYHEEDIFLIKNGWVYAKEQPWAVWPVHNFLLLYNLGERVEGIVYEDWLDYPPKDGE